MLGVPKDKIDEVAKSLVTWQNMAMGAVGELMVFIFMLLHGVEHQAYRKIQANAGERPAVELRRPATMPMPQQAPVALKSVDRSSRAIAAPRKQRLVSSQPPIGKVAAIFAELLNPDGGKIEIADSYEAYAAVCDERGLRKVSMDDYPAELMKLCKRLEIEVEQEGEGVFLKGVSLIEKRAA